MAKTETKEPLGLALTKLILSTSLIVSLGALIGATGYLVSHPKIALPISVAPNITVQPLPTEVSMDNWQTYRNEEYGFELKYPSFMYKISKKIKDATEKDKNDVVFGFVSDIGSEEEVPAGYFIVRLQDKQFDPNNIETIDEYSYSLNDVKNGNTGTWKVWKENIQGKEVYLSEFGAFGISGIEAVMPINGKLLLMEFGNEISENNYPEKIISTFKFIGKPCQQEDAGERISCFTDYIAKNSISEDIINSDDKLKKYFSENLDDLTFTGISRGKFDKFNNKNIILVSMYWSAGKVNQSHIFILKENSKKNWAVSHQELDYFFDFVNDPKILVKNEPAFFIGRTNYTGGTCVPVSWDTLIYRLENNKFNSLWSTKYFADGAIYDSSQKESVNSVRQIESFRADITYKDIDNDGNSEIIKEGTVQKCQEKDACYSNDCTKFFGEEKIYEVYKWNSQKQTFIKTK